MKYYLIWFENDNFVDEFLLDVTENEVREIFNLKPCEYAGDCLEVKEKHIVDWLRSKIKNVNTVIDLDKYEYFVEASA